MQLHKRLPYLIIVLFVFLLGCSARDSRPPCRYSDDRCHVRAYRCECPHYTCPAYRGERCCRCPGMTGGDASRSYDKDDAAGCFGRPDGSCAPKEEKAKK